MSKEMKSLKFPGTDESYEVVDQKAREDIAKQAEKVTANTNAISANARAIQDAVDSTNNKLTEVNNEINTKIDGAYVDDNGMLCLTIGDEVVAGPFEVAGGGGSGGGTANNATLTLSNTTGWLAKVISSGSDCVVTANWSSIEDGIATGGGALKITVNGAVKSTSNVQQGDISVNLKPYLAAGNNTVKLNISDVYGNSRTISYSINCIALLMESNFDPTPAFSGDIQFPYTPTGAVEKTVHILLDGTEIGTQTVTASGREQTFTIPAQAHGSHTVRAWFDAVIDGETVKSNELYYDLNCIVEGNTTVNIMSAFRQTEAEQYALMSIEHQVYDPSNLTAAVTYWANGVQVAEGSVDRTVQAWNYRPTDVGDLTLEIKCGDTVKTFNLTIAESSVQIEAETQNLQLFLTSEGRSNIEANPGTWVYGDVEASFSGFNWVSDGWKQDESKNTVLRVTGDARVEIPMQIFATDFRTSGKTIEVEFASRDVLDYNAMILSSVSGDRGIEITAQRADMTSEQSTIGTQYKEDEHVRLTFVTEKRSGNRLILIYLNGIISGIKQYPDTDDFSQATPVGISIGSNDCTIDLYNIRVYGNDLTRYQVVENWIADTQDLNTRFERFERNQVYDAYGAVVKEQLPKYLPYFVIIGSSLPQDKGDKKTISGYYVDPLHPEKSFTFTDAQIDVQGTSSKDYYVKNFKIKFKNGFEISGVIVETYQLSDDSIATDTYTMKADVASSEGANNVELVRLYNDISPHRTPPQLENEKVRQGIDGYPIVIFWDNGTTIKFLGKYNFNHDKGTPEVFGLGAGDESWEIKNNVSDRVMFKSADFSDTSTATGWLNDFEARHPEDNTDCTNLKAFAEWIVSTDRTAATGAAITAVTYEGVEYTTDTAAYRLAKFRNELADHASVESAQFYWLFTEFFLMIDSRAKNAFPTRFAADGKWCWLPYDMDTAIGINNEGSLVFGYSLEDTDYTESGAQVFNGQQSVFWNNVRDAFWPEIKQMYADLRKDGKLTYEDVIERFTSHQSAWPEAICNEDAYRKYIEPYVVEGATMYFAMAQGKKELQRAWWLYNRFRYFDAKCDAGDIASDRILIRIYASADIPVVPYADTYLRSKYGSYTYETRAWAGQEYTLTCYVDAANDLETTIFPASLIAEIADLSALKIGLADFSKAIKLQVLKIGDGAADYSNGNLTELTLGNNTLLRSLDVRNCPALAMAIDLTGCTNIETVLFDGTSVTGVSLPNGGMVKTLHLPGTVTNLTILNQSKIEDFVLPSYSQITTLRLENVSSAIDTATILAAIPAQSRVRLIGLDWNMDDAEAVLALYDHLDTMKGLDEFGNNVDQAQVSGTLHIDSLTGAQLAEMKARYPYITVDYQHITSYCYFYSYDGNTLLYTATVQDGADAVYSGSTPSRSSTAQYTYSFSGWSLTAGGSANSNALKAVTADRNVYAAFTSNLRYYTVYFYNGSTLLQTVNNVPYGGSATYTGDTPVDAENGLPFEGWSPSPSGITGNTSCYAQYTSPKEVVEITDDWDTIIASIDDGTYLTKYKPGNYKPLDLGSEGIINMQIAGFNKDVRADGNGTAPVSWIAVELLNTSRRINSSLVTKYKWASGNGWGSYSRNSSTSSDFRVSGSSNIPATGETATWELAFTAARDFVVEASAPSINSNGSGFSNDYAYEVTVNGTTLYKNTGGTVEVAAGTTLNIASGEAVAIKLSFTQDSAATVDSYKYVSYAYLKFTDSSAARITMDSASGQTSYSPVISTNNIRTTDSYVEGTGAIGGWEKSELRTYFNETILPLIPENVRNRIVTVTKTQPAYNTSGSQFTQTTEDAVWIPSYAEMFGTSSLYKVLFENTNANRKKYKVGSSSASWWWLRSANYNYYFSYVCTDGSANSNSAYTSGGLALGFCIS